MYTVEFENTAITNANGDYDWFEITPADDSPLRVHGIFITQSTEIGDAQEEMLRYKVIRGHATTGNGTATTPAPLNPNDPASSFTAETVASTPATTGTPVDLHSGTFNVRTGLEMWLPPEAQWVVTQAQTMLVVRLMAAVTDDMNMSGTLYVEEG
jgi:hypothetical protein